MRGLVMAPFRLDFPGLAAGRDDARAFLRSVKTTAKKTTTKTV